MDTQSWVRTARKQANLTQEQLGEKLGMTKGNVSGWENGRHAPSYDQMLRIAKLTGSVLPGSAPPAPHVESLEYAGLAQPARRIPVVGNARMGPDGYYELLSVAEGAGDGYVEIASKDPGAYALRVRGMSMYPAIRDGWYVIVEPSKTCHPGSYVLIQLRDGRKMVKELLFERDGVVEVMSINGGERMSFELHELEDQRGIQSVGAVLPASQWSPD